MLVRIPQRAPNDCAICAVSMVLGPPYGYERVRDDRHNYPLVAADGRYVAWWERYLRDEGVAACYCPFGGLAALPDFGGAIVGLLVMTIRPVRSCHVVAVDEYGVLDPDGREPDHAPLDAYVLARARRGVEFDDRFLAVRRRDALPAGVTGTRRLERGPCSPEHARQRIGSSVLDSKGAPA